MSKIIPHMWFDKEAKEATEFYTSIFPNSKINNLTVLHNTPSGDCDVLSFELWGQQFMAISAGPHFRPTPAISFMVNFDPLQLGGSEKEAQKALDTAWAKLTDGGTIRMELGEYPFSKYYGWVSDRYGFDWQLILTNPESEKRPAIIPSLLYVSDSCEIAEEATDFYLSVFKNTKRGTIARYPAGMGPNKEGAIMFTDYMLEDQWFAAMDGSSKMHNFAFNEATSFLVNCENQQEIDYYWEKLSAVPEAEQCGWLKDRYGVSWQIVPTVLDEMMSSGNQEKVDRLTQTFLKMKKFNIEELKKVFEEEV